MSHLSESYSIFVGSNKKSKEYIKSPFRYPGGKYYALKHLLPYITSVPHDEFREPFIGGGSVFFAKPKVAYNWINDLEKDLVTTYKVIADSESREKLCKLIEVEEANRERHEQVKKLSPQTDLEVAFKTFYLNRTSYSGIIHKPAWGYADGKSSPPKNWSQFIRDAGNKLADVKVTCSDFEDVILSPATGKKVLMYLDPPYYHADQKRAYTKPFVESDHVRLAKILKRTRFLFCLSYDDCEEIRDLYSWACIHKLNWLYNTANKKGEQRQLGQEVVITNYNVIRSKQAVLL